MSDTNVCLYKNTYTAVKVFLYKIEATSLFLNDFLFSYSISIYKDK